MPSSYLAIDKRLIKTIFLLSLPVLIVQITSMGRSLIATFFIAKLGGRQLAILATATSIVEPCIFAAMGLLSGTAIVVSSCFTKNQQLREAFFNSIIASIMFGLILGVAMWFSRPLAILFGVNEIILPLVVKFLRIYSFGVVPFLLLVSMRYFLLGLQKKRFLIISSIIGFLLCFIFTYLLSSKQNSWWFCDVLGFPIAFTVSSWGALIITAVYIYRYIKKFRIFEDAKKTFFHFQGIPNLVKLGIPASIIFCSESLILAIIVFFLQQYPLVYLEAFQITFQIFILLSIWPLSIGQAIMVLSAQLQDRESLKKNYIAAIYMFLSFVTVAGFIIFLFRKEIIGIYSTSQTSAIISEKFLALFLILLMVDGFKTITLGMLRGLQNVWGIVSSLLISYWVISTTFVVLVHIMKLTPILFIVGMILGTLVYGGVILYTGYNYITKTKISWKNK